MPGSDTVSVGGRRAVISIDWVFRRERSASSGVASSPASRSRAAGDACVNAVTEAELAHLDHVLADEELDRVIGDADRANLQSLSIVKYSISHAPSGRWVVRHFLNLVKQAAAGVPSATMIADAQLHEFSGQSRQLLVITSRPAIFEQDGVALDVTCLSQTLQQ
jgi:hypothetical protein